ncbi:MAG: Pentalenolactone F synthase [Alphaproteobacteria bacterium MarineAlpha4_Bin2]|nr:MAG: Pentalenolactone F synthase [Alphaproteobacteria bacterium MarineAlpha4_Bin2]
MTEIKIIPTGGALGAEVRGVELHGNITPDKVEALKQAWYDHLVLLFRKQQLNDNDLLRASSIFGPLQVGGAIRYFLEGSLKEGKGLLSQHNEITVVSNLDDRGNPVRVNAGLGSNEVIWHSDNSYVETPPAGSMLYAIQIPENGGGDTSFANQYLAYETLPDIMRIAIEGKQQRHDASRNSAGVLRPTANLPKTPEEVEGPVHPLVRVHPETGRKALYLGRRRNWPSNYILDIPIKRSEALLDRLWRHATKPEFVWTHQWRPGDVLLWDNRCVMHYRTEVDHTRPRVLHRTQIQGETVIPG